MKVTVELLGVRPEEVGTGVWERLCAIYPSGLQRFGGFRCSLPAADLRLIEMLDVLNEAGCRPWSGFGRMQPGEYWMRKTRTYSPSDLDACEYLLPEPKVPLGEYADRQPSGLLTLPGGKVRSREPIGLGASHWEMISPWLKGELEQSNLRHFLIRDIEVVTGRVLHTGVVYELTSDFTLPPLSPSCRLLGADGEPFNGDFAEGCFLREDYFRPPELHYRASDLRVLEPFDLALTYERFGNGDPVSHPFLVASQRFRQFCLERKLKMDWLPVHVDSECGCRASGGSHVLSRQQRTG